MSRYSVSCAVNEATLVRRPGAQPTDLLLIMRCFGIERSTTIKTNKTNLACWNEAFHWSNMQLSTSDWNLGVLEFELQSANPYWRNDTLGVCSLQLRLVRSIHDKCFSGTIALTMPNSVRVTGHLSVTVNVYDSKTSDGCQKISLSGAPMDTGTTEAISPTIPSLLSPSVYKSEAVDYKEEYKYYHLYVNVYTLEHLEVGILGFSPYITVDYGSCHLQSTKAVRSRETVTASPSPKLTDKIVNFFFGGEERSTERCNFSFNQCFLIPVRTAVGKPILEDNVIVRICMGVEVDPTLSNQNKPPISPKVIAEGVFSLAKLRARRQAPRWFNFYEDAGSTPGSNQYACDMGIDFGSKPMGADKYIGRILMSASVKSISKPGDVLHAHTLSSHQLEPPIANPTRLFSDAYCIHSSASFGFDGNFEVMLEVSCGPYETGTSWLPVQVLDNSTGRLSDETGLFNASEGVARSNASKHGWKVALDSIKGRLPPLDLHASYSPEQQWLIFVRVKARGTIKGRKKTQVIGSARFLFEGIPDSSSNAQALPFWLPLSCPIMAAAKPSDEGSLFDPDTIYEKVSSLDSYAIVNHAISVDPTGLIEKAAKMASVSSEGFQKSTGSEAAKNTSHYDPLSQEFNMDGKQTTGNPPRDGAKFASNSGSRRGLKSTQRLKENTRPTPGDTCDVGATVNVLMSLQKRSFYSDVSSNASVGNDLRKASHPPRVSMVKMEYELRCYLYCAKLACCPGRRVAATVSCDSRFARTQVQKNFTRFPVFAECSVLQVAVPTTSSGGIASPVPITLSLVFFDGRNRLVRCESAVTTYRRLVKSASGHDASEAPSPIWLKLSGDSEILFFTELVIKGEAAKIPKYQMLPLMTKCSVKLGIVGIRNLKLPEGYRLDGVYIQLTMQSYGVNVERQQSVERAYQVGTSEWLRGAKCNFDLFTVQSHVFDIPRDPLYDPHVEFVCYGISQDKVGPVLGYHCFPCYPAASTNQSATVAFDLRHTLNPGSMVKRLYELMLNSSQSVFTLEESKKKRSTTKLVDGMPEVLSKFESSKEHSRLLRSMDATHVGVQVPARMVLACNGKELPSKTLVGYVTVVSDILDKILADIPFSVCNISLSNRWRHRSNKGQQSRMPSSLGESHHSRRNLINGNKKNDEQLERLSSCALDQVPIELCNVPSMKYFMTIKHGNNGPVYRSYPEAMATPATNAGKMQRAFRSCLRNRMFKLRFCVVSANNIVPDCDTVWEPYLVVGISNSESREPLTCERGAIHTVLHRTWEQDIFLPEDSLIRLAVVNTVQGFQGNIEDELIASAQIDLENRWYSKIWQRMLRKDILPIERVVLRDRNNSIHGSLSVIVQVGSMDLFSTLKPLKFCKTTHSVTEVRVIIWSTKGVRLPTTSPDSKKKDQLDLYVVSRLDCPGYRGEHPHEQMTDTHYNCDSGSAQFNWRVLYPEIHQPIGACQLQLSVYDFWKAGPPVFVGEVNLELKHYINVVSTSSNRIQLSGELPLVNASSSLAVGTLNITLQVITQNESSCTPAGLGRSEPNTRPYLPPPQAGRQWNDWFAHTVVNFDFGALSIYIKAVSCILLLLWLFFISFVYPALLM